MAVAIMKIRRVWIGTVWIRVMLRRVVVIRLMWMPGIRPVIVPMVHPSKRAIIISSVIMIIAFFPSVKRLFPYLY